MSEEEFVDYLVERMVATGKVRQGHYAWLRQQSSADLIKINSLASENLLFSGPSPGSSLAKFRQWGDAP